MSSSNFPINFILKVTGDQQVVSRIRALSTEMQRLNTTARTSATSFRPLATAFTSAATSGATASTRFNALRTSLGTLSSATSTVATSVGRLSPVFSSAAAAANAAGASLSRIGTTANSVASSSQRVTQVFTSMGTSATGARTSIGTLSTAMTQTGTASGQAAAMGERFVTVLATTTTAATAAGLAAREYSLAQNMVSTSSGLAGIQMQTQVGALTVTGGAFNAAAVSSQRYSTTLTSSGIPASTQMASSSTRMGAAVAGTAASSEKASGGMKAMGMNMAAAGRRSIGLGLAILMLKTAMDEAVGMAEMKAEADRRVTESQAALNGAVAAYGPHSKEASAATKELEQAERAQAIAQRNAGLAMSDSVFFIGLIAADIGGILLPVIRTLRAEGTTLSGMFTGLGAKLKGFGTSIAATAAGTATASAASAKYTGALSGIGAAAGGAASKAGLFGVAIAEIAAILVALAVSVKATSSNMVVTSDAFDQAGKAIGNTAPPLKDFLTNLRDAGDSTTDFAAKGIEAFLEFLGITQFSVDNSKLKLSELIQKYVETGTTGRAETDTMVQGMIAFGKSHGQSVDEVIKKQQALEQVFTDTGETIKVLPSAYKLVADGAKVMVGDHEVLVHSFKKTADGSIVVSQAELERLGVIDAVAGAIEGQTTAQAGFVNIMDVTSGKLVQVTKENFDLGQAAGLTRQEMVQLGPSLGGVATALADQASEAAAAREGNIALLSAIEPFPELLKRSSDTLQMAADALGMFSTEAQGNAAALAILHGEAVLIEDELFAVQKSADGASMTITGLASSVIGATEPFKNLGNGIVQAGDLTVDFNGILRDTIATQQNVATSTSSFVSLFVNEYAKAGVSADTFIAALDAMPGVSDEVVAAVTKQIEALGFQVGETEKAVEATKELTAAQQAQVDAAQELIGSSQDRLIALTGENEVLKELATSGGSVAISMDMQAVAMAEANAELQRGALFAMNVSKAYSEMAIAAIEDTTAKNANAKATELFAGSSAHAALVIATMNEEVANSISTLAELDTQLNTTAGSQALLENAVLKGKIEFMEFLKSTQENVASQKEYESQLLASVGGMSEFLSIIGPTAENLEALQAASMGSAEGFETLRQAAQETFDLLAGSAIDTINTLSDALREGGEEGRDKFKEAISELPDAVNDTLDETEREALEGFGRMDAALLDAQDIFNHNFIANWDGTMDDFNSAIVDAGHEAANYLRENRDELPDAMQPTIDQMITDFESGNVEMIKRALEIIKSYDGPFGTQIEKMVNDAVPLWAQGGKVAGETYVEGVSKEMDRLAEVLSQSATEPEGTPFRHTKEAIPGKLKLLEEMKKKKKGVVIPITLDTVQLESQITRVQSLFQTGLVSNAITVGTAMGNNLQTGFAQGVNLIQSHITRVQSLLQTGLVSNTITVGTQMGNNLQTGFGQGVGLIQSHITRVQSLLQTGLVSNTLTVGTAMGNNLQTGFGQGVSLIQSHIVRVQSLLQTGLVSNTITVGTQMGNNLASNFETIVTPRMTSAITRIQSLWQTGLVSNAITVGTQMGNNMSKSFETIAGPRMTTAITRIQSLWQTGLVSNAITVGTQMGNNLISNFEKTGGSRMTTAITNMQTTMQGLVTKAQQVVADINSAFEGIKIPTALGGAGEAPLKQEGEGAKRAEAKGVENKPEETAAPTVDTSNIVNAFNAVSRAALFMRNNIQQAATDISNVFGSLITILAAHTTTLTTYFQTTIPAAFAASTTAFNNFGVAVANTMGSLITILAAHVTTINTYFTATLPAAFVIATTAFNTFGISVANTMGSLITILQAHVTTIGTYFTATLPAAFTVAATAFDTSAVSISNTMGSLITILGAHVTTINTYFTQTVPDAFATADEAVKTATANMQNSVAKLISELGRHVTTINTYFTQTVPDAMDIAAQATLAAANSMSSSIGQLVNILGQHTRNIEDFFGNRIPNVLGQATNAFSNMASRTSSSMNQMANSINQVTDAVNELTAAINALPSKTVQVKAEVSGQSEVESLRNAIDSLQDKTVTVTRVNRVKTQMINAEDTVMDLGAQRNFQTGGAFVTKKPMRLAGRTIGEAFRNELVTITPLTGGGAGIGTRDLSEFGQQVMSRFDSNRGRFDESVRERMIAMVQRQIGHMQRNLAMTREAGQDKQRKVQLVVHNITTLDGQVISNKTRRFHYKGLQALL